VLLARGALSVEVAMQVAGGAESSGSEPNERSPNICSHRRTQ
jgi:hypothetical protein